MNLQEMIESVRSNLNEEDTTGFYSDKEIKKWLNRGYTQFVTQVEPNSMQETQYIETNGQEKYQLPGDFLKEFRVELNGNKLDRISQDNFGDKKGYYIWSEDLYISQDEKGKRLDIYYFKTPTRMEEETSTPDIKPQFHSFLTDYATYKALQKDQKAELAEIYKRDFREGISIAMQFNQKPTKRRWSVNRI